MSGRIQSSQTRNQPLIDNSPYRVSSVFETISLLDGSPGLGVMGGGLLPEGGGFESQHRMMDGHFFTHICYKEC